MKFLTKKDFSISYDYNHLKIQRQKEYEKWKWIVLACCLLLQMFTYCVAVNLNNPLSPTFLSWIDHNPTIYGLGFTLSSVFAALVGPFIAKLFKKDISVKFIYSLGVIVAMFGFALLSINAAIPPSIRSLPQAIIVLWASNITTQIGVMIFAGLGINNLISKWWPNEKRGFALGLAFTGGSLGNIWMQQLLAFLVDQFKNNSDVYGLQYVTFLILTSIGLISGLLIVFFLCKKPLPDIAFLQEMKQQSTQQNQIINGVSPLVTKKYPFYWILAIGYLIIQMGSIHTSINGIVIQFGTVVNKDLKYEEIIAIGGTLFGVSCLFGNFFGGVINDKLGPHKSIFLAGIIQVTAIFLLMYSVKSYLLVFIYFILSGISIYIYTSTTSYLSGRLYGTTYSNSHMAILTIFVALGFAISNSVYGSIVGKTTSDNIHYMFNEVTYGDIQSLLLYAMICIALGTTIVAFSSLMILKKGIKGLEEFSFNKKTLLIFFKYSFAMWFYTNKSYKLGVNYKKNRDNIVLLKKNKLSINKHIMNDLYGVVNNSYNYNKNLQYIQQKDYIIFKNDKYYVNENWFKSLNCNDQNNEYFKDCFIDYTKIKSESCKIDNKILKIKLKNDKKIAKIDKKIDLINSSNYENEKNIKLISQYDKKIKIISNSYQNKLSNLKDNNDWNSFKFEYEYLSKILKYQTLIDDLNIEKEIKINNLNKKKMTTQYIANFNIQEQNKNLEDAINYYSNKYLYIDKLIANKIKLMVDNKVLILNRKINNLNKSISFLQNKKSKLLINMKENKLKKQDLLQIKLDNILSKRQRFDHIL